MVGAQLADHVQHPDEDRAHPLRDYLSHPEIFSPENFAVAHPSVPSR